MSVRSTSVVILLVPIMAALVGCSQVQEAVTGAAGDAAGQVKQAATDEAKRAVCAPVADGAVTMQDQQILSGLLATAQTTGVDARILAPLKQIAQAGDQIPADAVTALLNACGISSSPSPQ